MVGAGEVDIIIILPKHFLCGKIYCRDLQTMINGFIIAAVNIFFLDVPGALKNRSRSIGEGQGAIFHKRKTSFSKRQVRYTSANSKFVYICYLPGTNYAIIIGF